MKDFFIKLIKHPIVINLLLLVVVSIAAVYGVLKWLDVYTRHNQAVIVPDVKGLSVDEAALFFSSNNLRYNVIDSVFSKDVAPGSIVEITPQAGSKVKEGRILFITINALTAQMAAIPEVEDLSFRQAYALLKSRGFNTIETEYVPGEYKDLAIAVKSGDKILQANEKVPLTSPLTLIVSSGNTEPEELEDTTSITSPVETLDSEDEKWF